MTFNFLWSQRKRYCRDLTVLHSFPDKFLDGSEIEVTWAKPVDRSTRNRFPTPQMPRTPVSNTYAQPLGAFGNCIYPPQQQFEYGTTIFAYPPAPIPQNQGYVFVVMTLVWNQFFIIVLDDFSIEFCNFPTAEILWVSVVKCSEDVVEGLLALEVTKVDTMLEEGIVKQLRY